jgi:hypothetical protein
MQLTTSQVLQRDLALFNPAIDSKLRSCDLVASLHLQLGSDRPGVARSQRWLGADELTLFQGLHGAGLSATGRLVVFHGLSLWLETNQHVLTLA